MIQHMQVQPWEADADKEGHSSPGHPARPEHIVHHWTLD